MEPSSAQWPSRPWPELDDASAPQISDIDAASSSHAQLPIPPQPRAPTSSATIPPDFVRTVESARNTWLGSAPRPLPLNENFNPLESVPHLASFRHVQTVRVEQLRMQANDVRPPRSAPWEGIGSPFRESGRSPTSQFQRPAVDAEQEQGIQGWTHVVEDLARSQVVAQQRADSERDRRRRQATRLLVGSSVTPGPGLSPPKR